MSVVFKTRHFKRTLFVAAVIGGMWYLYVTKDSKSSNSKDSASNGESDRPLSLQERMQEVLAAREWLAENSAQLAGYNARGGGGREEDAYSPNLLFNNAPPPPPGLRTYYGAVGAGAGGVDDGRRFQSAWGSGGMGADNVALPGLPRPFAGESGDLNKYIHVGADDPGYSDAVAQSGGNGGGGGGEGGGVGGGGGAAGRMPLAAAQQQQGPGEVPHFGSSSQNSPATGGAAAAPSWNENTPGAGGFQQQFQPQFPPDDMRKVNPGGVPPQAWNVESYPPQQQQQQSFNAPNVFAPESGIMYPNPTPQHADTPPLKYPAYPPQQAAGPSGFDRPSVNHLETGGSAPGRGMNLEPPPQHERPAVSLVDALRARAAESDSNPGPRDEPERQKASQASQDAAGAKRGDANHGDANPDPTAAEEVRERQGHFAPTSKPHLPPVPPSSASSATGGRPEQTLQKTPTRGSADDNNNNNPSQQREPLSAAQQPLALAVSGRQGDNPAIPNDAALLPPTTPEAEQSQSFVGKILARLLTPAKGDGKDSPASEDGGVGSRKRGEAERDRPAGAAGKDARGLARSTRTLEARGQGPAKAQGRGETEGRGQGESQGHVRGQSELESQGQSGDQGQAGGQVRGVREGSEPGYPGAGRVPVPTRPSSFGLLSSVAKPNGFPQQLQQQQLPQPQRGNPAADIYLMQQRQQLLQQQQQQQQFQQRLPSPSFPQQPGQQLLQQHPQHQQPQQHVQQVNQNVPAPDSKNPLAAASPDDLTTVTMVTRDRTHWKEEECPAKDDSLTQATLNTPFGNVPLYVEKGVDDTEAYNRAFGVQWNMHGIGTFFDRCLLPDPNVTLVDIGAGLGPVSLTAARLGRQVFAIEPMDAMVGALCRSITDFRYNNVRVMHNAVSDERTKVYYRRSGNKNQPTDTYIVDTRNKSKIDPNSPSALAIRLDDMLRLYKVSRVAVRMDLRGMEGRALVGSNKFFNTLDISCILMDWSLVHSLKEYGGSYVLDALTSRGFFPHHVHTMKPLKVFRMHDWPTEVLWAKLGSVPVKL